MIELKILGLGVELGDVGQLKEQAGAPELLFDTQWENRGSIIPPKTMRDLGNIPRSAGFVRGAQPTRRPVSKRKQSVKPPPEFTVEEDKLVDEEFQKIPELTELFIDCLADFPELVSKEIECRATRCSELAAAKGTLKGKPVVILFVPEQAWGKWASLRPLILHELCHFIDPSNPDRVFDERADKESRTLWSKLRELGQVHCK